MSGQAGTSSADALARFVRRHDPDRFLTTLFAPPARRPALLALYAFNHELARALDVATQPMLALIRLQWWREVVEGAARRHEVAEPLAAALAAGALDRRDLLALIEAREAAATDWMGSETAEAPSIATVADWQAWLHAGAGGLAVAAGRALGAADPEALRPHGAAYGAAGVLRSMPLLARRGRCLLPADVLAVHGLNVAALLAAPNATPAQRARAELAGIASAALPPPRPMPADVIAAALPAVLARRDLRHLSLPAGPRGVADRLAVTWAAWRGRA